MWRTGAEVVRRLTRSQEESNLAFLSRGSFTAGASLARLLLVALAARSSPLFEIAFFPTSFTLALFKAIFSFKAAFLRGFFMGETTLAPVFLEGVFFEGAFVGETLLVGEMRAVFLGAVLLGAVLVAIFLEIVFLGRFFFKVVFFSKPVFFEFFC